MELRHPVRVSHEHTQSLVAPPSIVFPLLCPVRERDWVPGWEPGFVISESGAAELDCVFSTPTEQGEATWYVSEHDPLNLFVEMLKIIPGFVATRLAIALEEADGRSSVEVFRDGQEFLRREVLCRAKVRYTHTALSTAGEAEVHSWDADRWKGFMEGWQTELNRYLVDGAG